MDQNGASGNGFVLKRDLGRHGKAVSSIKICPTRNVVAVVTAEGTATIYNLDSELEYCPTTEISEGINDVKWCGDTRILTASDDKCLKIFDVEKVIVCMKAYRIILLTSVYILTSTADEHQHVFWTYWDCVLFISI
jgi:WD40 repeat protein